MTDESLLRRKAREAIQARRLPQSRPARMWGGPGVGACCTICGERMGRNETEFELQFDGDGAAHGAETYHLHIGCFAAWEFERQSVEVAPGAISQDDRMRRAADPSIDRDARPPSSGPAVSSVALRALGNNGMIARDGRNGDNRGESG